MLSLKIEHDPDCESPLANDDAVKVVILHRNHENPTPALSSVTVLEQWCQQYATDYAVFPLFMLDHSGVSFSTKDFNDRWDSGRVGVIALKRSEFHHSADLEKVAQDTLDLYTDWCNGQCFGYIIEDEHEEQLDSCWGYIGYTNAEDVGRDRLAELEQTHVPTKAVYLTEAQITQILEWVREEEREGPDVLHIAEALQ
jgi:hypothetical protein